MELLNRPSQVWCLDFHTVLKFLNYAWLESPWLNDYVIFNHECQMVGSVGLEVLIQEHFVSYLTHICLVVPSILINWMCPFPISGVSDVLFHFYSILNKYSC